MRADEITCRQFVELVTDYFEGGLTEPIVGRVEEHLVMCEWCETYAEQVRATIAALRRLPTSGQHPEPTDMVLEALRARQSSGR